MNNKGFFIKNKLILLVFLWLNASCQDDSEGELGYINKEQKFQVSIYTIAGNSSGFEGKPVYLKGYMKYDSIGVNIYPDKYSCLDSFYENSIGIAFTKDQFKFNFDKIKDCEIITILGTYRMLNEYSKDRLQNLTLGLLEQPIKLFN
ncbi:MAG: hypothetical protein AB8B80_08875 [Marinicellaceae bacterium]